MRFSEGSRQLVNLKSMNFRAKPRTCKIREMLHVVSLEVKFR